MDISPDSMVWWSYDGFRLNATIVFTWVVMALLTLASWLISRRLSSGTQMSRWQNLLEVIVSSTIDQIREVTEHDYSRYLPFIGSLFLYILTSNLLAVVPGFVPPTGALSTTTALAICVLVAVPLYGIASQGLLAYLKHYIKPTPLMLPFNIIGELSRTIALAVRLYGNIMSGTVIVGILLSLTPFFFPLVMQLLGLITGTIQAYIFAILAMVYIASASSAHQATEARQNDNERGQQPPHPSANKGDSNG